MASPNITTSLVFQVPDTILIPPDPPMYRFRGSNKSLLPHGPKCGGWRVPRWKMHTTWINERQLTAVGGHMPAHVQVFPFFYVFLLVLLCSSTHASPGAVSVERRIPPAFLNFLHIYLGMLLFSAILFTTVHFRADVCLQ